MIETLRPNANGDVNQWTPQGAATGWECVAEAVADENTTHVLIAVGLSNQDDLYHLGNSALGGSETINSVTLWARAGRGGTGNSANLLWKENGVTTAGAAVTLNLTYTDTSETRATRPSDGAAWTLADLNGLQVGVRGTAGASGSVRVTQIFVEVDYTPAGGGARNALMLVNVGG